MRLIRTITVLAAALAVNACASGPGPAPARPRPALAAHGTAGGLLGQGAEHLTGDPGDQLLAIHDSSSMILRTRRR